MRDWKEYRKNHLEERKKSDKKYRLTHKRRRNACYKEYMRQYCRNWRKSHSDREYRRKYRAKNPARTKTIDSKHQAKRRELGFIPLNEPFAGSVGHHIDKNFVVYIPEFIHTSIPHNVFTGQNMNIINAKAMSFL